MWHVQGGICNQHMDSLDVDIAVDRGHEDIGHEIILHPWVCLHDVPSLPAHVQVVDGGSDQLIRTRANGKGMRPNRGTISYQQCHYRLS